MAEKSRVVAFRVSDQVYGVLKTKAGLMTVSEYCKYLVLKEADRKHKKGGD